MDQKELDDILKRHADWLRDEGGERANLRGVDLSYANLRYAILSGADLSYANLSYANLRCANLSDAILSGANLSGADFRCAILSDAILSGADFRSAILSDADFSGANLTNVNLWGTIGNQHEIRTLLVSELYVITYTHDRLQIGCEQHPRVEWEKFDTDRIYEMDGVKAVDFWLDNKQYIFDTMDMFPATKWEVKEEN